jgi:hypothetical protein
MAPQRASQWLGSSLNVLAAGLDVLDSRLTVLDSPAEAGAGEP